jgi:hypothetical protein
MARTSIFAVLAFTLSIPAIAQQAQTCNLQITLHCTSGSSSTACTSTTLNGGNNVCSGQYFVGFFADGDRKVTGFQNSLGITQCFDSSLFPTPGESFVYCFGPGSLAPNGNFTGTTTITGSAGDIIAITGVFDDTFATEKALVFAQAGVTPLTCTPTISSPPVTQSGLTYTVSWTAVLDPNAQFRVDESTAPDFSSNVTTTQVNGFAKTFQHTVTTNTTFYYRVTPTSCSGGTPATSGISQTVVKAPAPPDTSRNPQATIPFGTKQPVSIPVFIPFPGGTGPAPAADPTYVASTDKGFLSVTPPSGTIPPGGTTVTVTADPGALPAGGSTGTLKVTTNGTTTTNTPISISLVTPVAPGSRTLPPPNALVIPIVTHVNAAAGPFLSDVRLTNGTSLPVNYQITMTPTNTDGTTSSKVTVVPVDGQSTLALNDIVNNFFGFGATGAPSDVGFGSLEIRPLDSGSLLTFAASRTYASVALGTFGQFISAIPFSKFASQLQSPINIPGQGPAHVITKLSLQQVSHSSRFRTNFGLAEGAGQPASGIIRIFNAAGANLKEVPFNLRPGEHQQLNGFIAANGIPTLDDGRIEVEITSPTGAVTAYASVLDNVTTDPLAVIPVDVAAISSARYTLPGIAELNNGASNFHSDVRIFNGGTSDVVATMAFFPFTGFPGAGATKSLTIRAGAIAVLDNVLPSQFNLSGTGGSILITTPSPSSLVATARTYTNVANNGTFGQFIPGVMPTEGVALGERPLQILQLEHSDSFRSNLGIVELTGNPATVKVSLLLPDSKVTPSIDVPLDANQFVQLNGIVGSLQPGAQTYNARITVEVISGTGRVSAYGSVIDNRSADPTYVPAQ